MSKEKTKKRNQTKLYPAKSTNEKREDKINKQTDRKNEARNIGN